MVENQRFVKKDGRGYRRMKRRAGEKEDGNKLGNTWLVYRTHPMLYRYTYHIYIYLYMLPYKNILSWDVCFATLRMPTL